MSETSYLATITVRMPISMVMELDNKAGRNKNGSRKEFPDRSAALRAMISLGFQITDLLKVYNDPEKAKEFDEKLASLFQEKEYEKTLETMSEKELNAILFIAKNLKDKKIDQLVFDIKKS